MPRFQILIVLLSLSAPRALAQCRIRAVGQVRFDDAKPKLVVFAGSLGELKLNILAAPGTDPTELLLHLVALKNRTVAISGGCAHAPRERRGEILTDVTHVRLTLPNALKPNNGGEVEVDPG